MFQAWGRLPSIEGNIKVLSDIDDIAKAMYKARNSIAYGAGRSYGDVCQSDGGTLLVTAAMDKFRSFNQETGELSVEAGVLLRDIQRHFTPLGWALPVTPGTQYVTVGGAIANDIHGKSHHVHGSFGHQVVKFTLIRSDGEVIECSANKNPKWFTATIGGIGLTGVISKATIKLERIPGPWIDSETIPFGSIEEFFSISANTNSKYENSVSWIDCSKSKSHRGLLMVGNRATSQKSAKFHNPKTLPFEPPFSLVNGLTLKPGNLAYYAINRLKPSKSVVHYEKFFYPLDGITQWNRVYGPKGFYQYQSVIPHHNALEATKEMLKVIGESGQGSMLGVLKEFGNLPSLGLLSFPMAGTTLALDFPNRGNETEKLFKALDAIVLAAQGRLYLAKDARMPREMFEASYLNLGSFKKFRDPNLSSAMSKRLMGN